MYGAELEYILYGKDSSKDNVKAAYTDIFAIREIENMGKITGDNNFKLSKSITYFEINEKLRIDPLMMTLPIFSNENSGYDRTKTDWCTYDVKVTRGY